MSNYWEEFDRHVGDHQLDLEQELNAALMALGIVKKEFEKLTQENARLREALNKLKRECTYCNDPENYTCSDHGDQIFSDALEGKE